MHSLKLKQMGTAKTIKVNRHTLYHFKMGKNIIILVPFFKRKDQIVYPQLTELNFWERESHYTSSKDTM